MNKPVKLRRKTFEWNGVRFLLGDFEIPGGIITTTRVTAPIAPNGITLALYLDKGETLNSLIKRAIEWLDMRGSEFGITKVKELLTSETV